MPFQASNPCAACTDVLARCHGTTRNGEGEIILQAKIPRVKIYHVDLKAPVKVTHCDMHIGQIYFLTLETTTRPSH